uniref:Retinoblastoma-like protein 1 n=1 Tax=Castor canadensis TaxID=51338 RepID=A0A8B7W022_CASCN|nr:retinoblastoma-like protein 1 [Castor canadensis]
MFEDEPHAEGAAVVAAAGEALQALCQELNLDEGSAAEALDDFTAIRGNYSLEGEVIHWLACSLYVACRKSIIPTVGKGIMEGNCVSLPEYYRNLLLKTTRSLPRHSCLGCSENSGSPREACRDHARLAELPFPALQAPPQRKRLCGGRRGWGRA